jgi:hypothetical protein
MKKLILLLLAVLMVLAMFVGCNSAGRDTDDDDRQESENVEVPSDKVSLEVPETSGITSTGNPVTDSYSAYVTAKTELYSRLTGGLSSNEETTMASMSLMGVGLIDMYLLPAAFFGLGEEAAAMGMGYLNMQGVRYTENGNSYTITYTDAQGATASLTGTYDAGADSLVCTGSTDGVENFYSEYRRAAYGYVGQYYFTDTDGSGYLYLVTISGTDGAFGMSEANEKPAALTGSERVDYPSICTEWYAINGTTITGVLSDGTAVNFEYVPTES